MRCFTRSFSIGRFILSCLLSVTLVFSQLDLVFAQSSEKVQVSSPLSSQPPLMKAASLPPLELGGNCGPKVLQAILEGMGRKTSLDPLILQTSTQRGQTSLAGLR
ncbi:MAG: hypothetical protein HYS07_03255, partial [Chlamydiae bacterium]|nr:hypothetical protein [Chlamydiota bacterium]MBI3276275.1 hypothetical protein [Chlamydiota bacterium]